MSSFFKSLGSGILRIFGATASEVEASTKELVKEAAKSLPKLLEMMQISLDIFKEGEQETEDIDTFITVLDSLILVLEYQKENKKK